MNKIIAIILIAVSLGLGYMGITELNESTASVSIGGLELSAESSDGKTTAYIYIGLAVIALIGGITLLNKK